MDRKAWRKTPLRSSSLTASCCWSRAQNQRRHSPRVQLAGLTKPEQALRWSYRLSWLTLSSGRGTQWEGCSLPAAAAALMAWSHCTMQLRWWLGLCSAELITAAITSFLKRNIAMPYSRDQICNSCFVRARLGQWISLPTFIRAPEEHPLQEDSQQGYLPYSCTILTRYPPPHR